MGSKYSFSCMEISYSSMTKLIFMHEMKFSCMKLFVRDITFINVVSLCYSIQKKDAKRTP